MNATTILSAIIAIVLADYLLERGLSFLNCRCISTQLPDEVKGIYSEEKYQQSQEYKRKHMGSNICKHMHMGSYAYGVRLPRC